MDVRQVACPRKLHGTQVARLKPLLQESVVNAREAVARPDEQAPQCVVVRGCENRLIENGLVASIQNLVRDTPAEELAHEALVPQLRELLIGWHPEEKLP